MGPASKPQTCGIRLHLPCEAGPALAGRSCVCVDGLLRQYRLTKLLADWSALATPLWLMVVVHRADI